MKNGLNITVSYRRNATWYTVKHWVPEAFAAPMPGQPAGEKETVGGTVYVLQDQEQMQGRVGGLTRAAEKVGGRYDLLVSIGFAQKLIQGEGTTVDIYYQAAESYRVILIPTIPIFRGSRLLCGVLLTLRIRRRRKRDISSTAGSI